MSQFTTANFFAGSVAPAPAASGDVWYNTTTGSTLQFNGSIWQGTSYENLQDTQNQVAAASYAVNHSIFVAPNTGETWQLKAVSVNFGVTSTSGTLQVEVATGTQAPAAGTNQLTGTIALNGTANTVVNGTVVAAPVVIAAGNRVNLIFAGTVTGLLNCVISVVLAKLS